jgi:hypothetical protein
MLKFNGRLNLSSKVLREYQVSYVLKLVVGVDRSQCKPLFMAEERYRNQADSGNGMSNEVSLNHQKAIVSILMSGQSCQK